MRKLYLPVLTVLMFSFALAGHGGPHVESPSFGNHLIFNGDMTGDNSAELKGPQEADAIIHTSTDHGVEGKCRISVIEQDPTFSDARRLLVDQGVTVSNPKDMPYISQMSVYMGRDGSAYPPDDGGGDELTDIIRMHSQQVTVEGSHDVNFPLECMTDSQGRAGWKQPEEEDSGPTKISNPRWFFSPYQVAEGRNTIHARFDARNLDFQSDRTRFKIQYRDVGENEWQSVSETSEYGNVRYIDNIVRVTVDPILSEDGEGVEELTSETGTYFRAIAKDENGEIQHRTSVQGIKKIENGFMALECDQDSLRERLLAEDTIKICHQTDNGYEWIEDNPPSSSCNIGELQDSPDAAVDNYYICGDSGWNRCFQDGESVDVGERIYTCQVESGHSRGSFEAAGYSCDGQTSMVATIPHQTYSDFPIKINGCTSKNHFVVKLKSRSSDDDWNYIYNGNTDSAVDNGVTCRHSGRRCNDDNFAMSRDGSEFTITIDNQGGRAPGGPKDSPRSEGEPVTYDVSLAGLNEDPGRPRKLVDSSLTQFCSSSSECSASDVTSDLSTTVGVIEHSYGEPITINPGKQLRFSVPSSVTCAEQITYGGPARSRKLYFGEETGIRNSYALNHVEDQVPDPEESGSSGGRYTISLSDIFATDNDVLTFARDTSIQFISFSGMSSETQKLEFKPICNSDSKTDLQPSGDSNIGNKRVTSYMRTNAAWVEACIDGGNSEADKNFCEPEDPSITVNEIVNTLNPCIDAEMDPKKTPSFSEVKCYDIVKTYCENTPLEYSGPESLEDPDAETIDNTCKRGSFE